MAVIEVQEHTAEALRAQAEARGLSLQTYLDEVARTPLLPREKRKPWSEIEKTLRDLAVDGPTLPADFSRADIYLDHD
jgi:hypothetical protein